MRNFLLAAAVLSVATPAYAVGGMAGAFGQKGQFVPFGQLSVGFESQNDNDNFTLQIDPGLLYFLDEHWAVGGTFSFDASVGDLDYSIFGLGPTIAYNYQLNKDFSFFPQGTFYFTVGGGDVNNDSVGVSGFTPVLWHLAEHFFVGAGPDVLIDFHNDAGERFRLGAKSVVGGWF